MEQTELTSELSTDGHTPATYVSHLVALGFSSPHSGGCMWVDFDRKVAIEVRESVTGCSVRGFRL